MQVKQIDEVSIKERLKKNGDNETLKYIKALQEQSDRWQGLANKAISEIKRRAII
jgi:hypothetical protein